MNTSGSNLRCIDFPKTLDLLIDSPISVYIKYLFLNSMFQIETKIRSKLRFPSKRDWFKASIRLLISRNGLSFQF